MTALKSLWASVQGDPKLMRRVNGWLTLFWVAMIPISMFMGWLSSVVYVSALSLWALVSGHWSAWQPARVEVNQQRADEAVAQVDLPAEVADEVVARTGLARSTSVISHALSPLGRRHVEPVRTKSAAEQAIMHLEYYAALTGLTLDVAVQQLLRSARAAGRRSVPELTQIISGAGGRVHTRSRTADGRSDRG